MELFHFKRQRKLSLRFLASYLLGASIQKDTHDSIVDARTALQLFQVGRTLHPAWGQYPCMLMHAVPHSPLRRLPCFHIAWSSWGHAGEHCNALQLLIASGALLGCRSFGAHARVASLMVHLVRGA